jgi:DNA-binding CsgD family transcriptional regulator/tetratricopeptide (TPR) repeat protein
MRSCTTGDFHKGGTAAAPSGAVVYHPASMSADIPEQLNAAQQLLWAGDVDAAGSTLGTLIDAHGDPTAYYLRGAIAYMDDRLDDACRDWEAAFQSFRDRGELERAARAAMGLAELHVGSLGHEAAGQGWLGRARRLLDRVGPCVDHGWFEIALMACTRPNVDDVLESADRALEIALEYGDPDLEVRALADSGLALVSQGRVHDGFARLDEALAAITGGQLRDPSVAGLAFCSMLASCDRSGDLRRAEEWNRLIDELVLERLGGRPRVLHTHCRVAYGSVLLCVGRWQEAEEVMLEALGPNASRSLNHRIDITARLAELRIDQGRIEEAARLVEPHVERVVMCNPRARIHVWRGEHDLAVAVAGRGLREFVGDAARRGPLLALTVQAELGRGDADAADRAARELATLAEGTDSAALHGEAALARGRVAVAHGDLATAAANLGEAARGFGRSERPLQSALARLELAESLAADGIRADAIVEARTALGVFTRLGARPAADRTAALLRGLGDTARVRPVDAAIAVGSLTRREAEVLALIREGLTNPEIGERLFISAKTAEHHVGRVLAKLGVRSRAEAAALAASVIGDAEITGIGGSS